MTAVLHQIAPALHAQAPALLTVKFPVFLLGTSPLAPPAYYLHHVQRAVRISILLVNTTGTMPDLPARTLTLPSVAVAALQTNDTPGCTPAPLSVEVTISVAYNQNDFLLLMDSHASATAQ